ncbi:MAG: VOC family protein [Acidimicrobiia bacterium]|nr:VOC family protein [Acidimicrobiia bacterium]
MRTPHGEEAAAFFADVLGLGSMRRTPEWSILGLPTGGFDLLEFYGPGFDDERFAPNEPGTFVGFVVDDIEGARDELEAAGAEPSAIVWAPEVTGDSTLEGVGWCFFRAPDGNTYVALSEAG